MMTKLILVEGLPGSGKTTTAVFVANWLQRQGWDAALFLEGSLDHPADFESVACLDARQYAALLARFPAEAPFLRRQAVLEGDDILFRYRALQQNCPDLDEALITALAQYEIYELPIATYQRLIERRWRRFAATAASGNAIYIFECCFLQNPLTMFLGGHDEPVIAAETFILELAAAAGGYGRVSFTCIRVRCGRC
jgi:hypothetical protein